MPFRVDYFTLPIGVGEVSIVVEHADSISFPMNLLSLPESLSLFAGKREC